MRFIELARNIRHKITKADTEGTIQLAMDALHGDPAQSEIILQAAQTAGIEQELRMGLISAADARVNFTRIQKALLDLANELEKQEVQQTRVFISFSFQEPDQALAEQIHAAVQQAGFPSFLAAKSIILGEDWAERILKEIVLCDYFVLLLSERSKESDMVLLETQTARRMQEVHPDKKPQILPIRLQLPLHEPFGSDLDGFLADIQQANWEGESDTERITEAVLDVLLKRTAGMPEVEIEEKDLEDFREKMQRKVMPQASLESVGGAMNPQSPFYIERKGEPAFKQLVRQDRAVLRIKAPRQYGKTSLLSRIISQAREDGIAVAQLSFQILDLASFANTETFLQQFCVQICRKLGILDKPLRTEFKEIWADEFLLPKLKCSEFFETVILPRIDQPFLLALDEADRLFPYKEVSTDFFAMLRAWHDEDSPIWDRFRLAMVYSSEITLAIDDLNQSPFNVGTPNLLMPFVETQLQELLNVYGMRFSDSTMEAFMKLFGGHPYLSRKALNILAEEGGEAGWSSLLESAPRDDGPFADHLRRLFFILSAYPSYCEELKQVLQKGRCRDFKIEDKLRAAGLIVGDGDELKPATDLYRRYFSQRL